MRFRVYMHEYAKTTCLLVWIRKTCKRAPHSNPPYMHARRTRWFEPYLVPIPDSSPSRAPNPSVYPQTKTTDTASAPTTATAAGAEIRVAGGSGGGKVQTFGGHPVLHPLYLNCPAIPRACGRTRFPSSLLPSCPHLHMLRLISGSRSPEIRVPVLADCARPC
jgi:hypothetical protein